MIVTGIDTGSADMGLIAIETDDTGKVSRLARTTIDVRAFARARDMRPAVAIAMAWIADTGSEFVAIERSDLYTPQRAPGQSEPAYAAMLAAMGRAWALTDGLAQSIAHACAALPSPIHGVFVPRQTWAHRLVRHHRGGVTDADVRAALPLYVDADLLATIHTKHETDALGAALWHVLPAPEGRPPRSRARHTPEEREAILLERAARDARPGSGPKRVAWATRKRAERVARGCICSQPRRGRHGAACPLAPPSTVARNAWKRASTFRTL